MFINHKVLNIPPFISVHWNQVEFLSSVDNILNVQLKSGKLVQLPDLTPEVSQLIFDSHATFLDLDKPVNLPPAPPLSDKQTSLFGSSDVKIGFSTLHPNGMGIPLQHMEDLREAPEIPSEILEKVRAVAKLVPIEDLINSPKPVENCHCPFCQIAAAIHSDLSLEATATESTEPAEEIVKDEELNFEPWNIFQKGDSLYEVQNKLDAHESYNVFLGEPVGCTCGKNGCEHILAVLKS
jgi:hypothetical protein